VLDTNDKGKPSLGAKMDEWDWMDKRMGNKGWKAHDIWMDKKIGHKRDGCMPHDKQIGRL